MICALRGVINRARARVKSPSPASRLVMFFAHLPVAWYSANRRNPYTTNPMTKMKLANIPIAVRRSMLLDKTQLGFRRLESATYYRGGKLLLLRTRFGGAKLNQIQSPQIGNIYIQIIDGSCAGCIQRRDRAGDAAIRDLQVGEEKAGEHLPSAPRTGR